MSPKTFTAALLVASASLTAGHGAAAGEAPSSWSELPQASLPAPPKTPPYRVGGGERVEGVNVTVPNGMGIEGMVVVTAPPPKAKPGDKPRPSSRFGFGGDAFADTCFTRGDQQEPGSVFAWGDSSDANAALTRQMGVIPIRSEKLVERGESVSLQVTDMWVDPATTGARLIGKREVPLKLMKAAPGDVRVYMARDAAAVALVVTFPKDQKFVPWSLMGERSDGRVAHSSGCRHLHVALAAEKGRGESVLVRAPSVLGT
ncbi:MAG: hypothetical protein JNL38_15245, partial [Myxococcales bacterium]|nr:hypothetical protein [Myxococcales bacterium]